MSYPTLHRPRLIIALALSCITSLYTIGSIHETGFHELALDNTTSTFIFLPFMNSICTIYFIKYIAERHYTRTNADDINPWPSTPIFPNTKTRRRYLTIAFMVFAVSLANLQIWTTEFFDEPNTNDSDGNEQYWRKLKGVQFLTCTLVLFQAYHMSYHEDHWQTAHFNNFSGRGNADLSRSQDIIITTNDVSLRLSAEPAEIIRAILTSSLILSTVLFLYEYVTDGGSRAFPPLLAILHHAFYFTQPVLSCPSRRCRSDFFATTREGGHAPFTYSISMGIVTTSFVGVWLSSWCYGGRWGADEWPMFVWGFLETLVVSAGFLHSVWKLPQCVLYFGSVP
jgi:hypothetical protein